MADMTREQQENTGIRQQPEDNQERRCPACGAERAVGVCWPAVLARPMAASLFLVDTLTPRERSVFGLLGSGYDNRSIARELNLSERTVKRYVTAILAKLELQSRLQAGLSALFLAIFPEAGTYWPEGIMDLSDVGSKDIHMR